MRLLPALGTRVGALAWLALVGVVLVVAEHRLAGTVAGHGTAESVSAVLLGLGFALTAVLLVRQEGQRGNAGLFALFVLSWMAGQWGRGGGWLFSAPLIVFGELVHVLGAAIVLRYPGARLDRIGRIYVIALACSLEVLQSGTVVTSRSSMWTTATPGLRWPTLLTNPSIFDAVEAVRWAAWAVFAGGFLILMGRRWRAFSPLERRLLGPIVTVSVVTAVLLGLRIAEDTFPDWLAYGIDVARTYSSAAVAAAFVVSAVQLTLSRVSVGDLAGRLARPMTAGQVREELRLTLGDPELEVWRWDEPLGGYVDSRGAVRAVEEVGDRLAVPVETSDGLPLAVVVATLDPVRHRGLLDAAVAVSRLALENAMLHESLEARVEQVREARSRLLRAGVEQRRQLERDLHDGAQQRLLAIGLHLGAIENTSGDPDMVAAVRAVRADLTRAQVELRRLANGLYPAVLSQAGVGAALEEVVQRLTIPVELQVEASRWSPDVENAVYLIACEGVANAIKHAEASRLVVRVREQGRDVLVEVVDDGRGSQRLVDPSALRSLRDRVEALGGELRVDSKIGTGTTVRALLPCA